MHILFCEQAVYERGTKTVKSSTCHLWWAKLCELYVSNQNKKILFHEQKWKARLYGSKNRDEKPTYLPYEELGKKKANLNGGMDTWPRNVPRNDLKSKGKTIIYVSLHQVLRFKKYSAFTQVCKIKVLKNISVMNIDLFWQFWKQQKMHLKCFGGILLGVVTYGLDCNIVVFFINTLALKNIDITTKYRVFTC